MQIPTFFAEGLKATALERQAVLFAKAEDLDAKSCCGYSADVKIVHLELGRLVCPLDGEMLLTKEERTELAGEDE